MSLSEKIRTAVRKHADDERQVDEIAASVEQVILGEIDELFDRAGIVSIRKQRYWYPDE